MFQINVHTEIVAYKKWKSKTWVTSYELGVSIHELGVQIYQFQVQIYQLRVQIHELEN